MPDDDTDTWEPPPPHVLAARIALGGGGIVLVVALLGALLRAPITVASAAFVGRFGIGGVFGGVYLIDLLPVSPHEPVLIAGHAAGIGFAPLAATVFGASVAASATDYAFGRLVGTRWAWLQALLVRYRVRAFMRRYGPWAVAACAVLPMPFTLVAWAAGMTGVSVGHVSVAAVLRAAKTLATLVLIVLGWGVSG